MASGPGFRVDLCLGHGSSLGRAATLRAQRDGPRQRCDRVCALGHRLRPRRGVLMLLDARTLGFASVATMFVVTPGVGTAVITRTVVERGRRAGFVTAAGLLSGSAVYALATALGLAALLVTFPSVLRAVQVVGAVYVAWLGVTTIRAAWR